MRRRLTWLAGTVLVLALVATMVAHPWHTAAGSAVTPADQAEIHDFLVQYYETIVRGLKYYDVSGYSQVFVNDPRVPLQPDFETYIEQVRARYGAAAELPANDGLLTWELAQVHDRQQAMAIFTRVMAKANSEGRNLTSTELQEATTADGELVAPEIEDGHGLPPQVVVRSVTLTNDLADVLFDDEGGPVRVTLVKTSGGWRMASVQRQDQ